MFFMVGFFSSFISTNSDEGHINVAKHFPNFVWAVRDHHLKLEIQGKEVTANDYLEFCLKFRPGTFPGRGGQGVAWWLNVQTQSPKQDFIQISCIPNLIQRQPHHNISNSFLRQLVQG